MNKTLTITLGAILALSSCISTKRLNKIVYKKVENAPHIWSYEGQLVKIHSDNLEHTDSLVVTEKIKRLFIPAILYWQWNSTNECRLASSLAISKFQSTVVSEENIEALKENLNGKKLELSVEKIPNSFIYTHKGYGLMLILFYAWSDAEAIYAQSQSLDIKYRVLDGDTVTKEGHISVNSKLLAQKNEMQSTKKFTQGYIDDYYFDIQRITDVFINQLIKELDTPS